MFFSTIYIMQRQMNMMHLTFMVRLQFRNLSHPELFFEYLAPIAGPVIGIHQP